MWFSNSSVQKLHGIVEIDHNALRPAPMQQANANVLCSYWNFFYTC